MMSSSVMANIGSYRWLLTGLMVGSVLVFSDQLLDYYHHSRFLFLSVIVFFFSIVLFICKRDKRLEFHSSKIGWALIGFAALNILSITWAAEKAEALFYTEKWIYAACLFYLLLWTFLERQENEVSHFIAQLARVTTTIILVVVFIPLINVIQKDGISNEALYQVKTMFGHKSLTSLFLFLLLPLNLLDKFERNFTWPVLLLVLCQILMILVLQSRAVYLSLFVFILIVGSHVFHYRTHWSPFLKKKYILPAVLIMVGAFVFLLQNDGFRERLNMLHYLKSQTSTERQDVWRMTKPLIREHWIMGVGPGNWKLQFPGHGVEGSYRMQDQNVFFTRAHNDFLEIFAELGLLGFSIYVFLFGYAFYQLHLARHKSPWKSRMLLAGMIGYLISSLIDFPKERLEFVTILILYLAVVESISAKKITKSLSPYFLMLITFFMILNILTGIKRYAGERNTALMLKARTTSRWDEVIQYSNGAENSFHHLDPYSVPIQFYRGLALYEKGDHDAAQICFERAHHSAPYNFHILNNLATISLERKNYLQADEWLNEALRINPRFEDALYNLSYSKAMQQKYEDALDILDQVPTNSERKKMFRQEIIKLRQNQGQH